MAVGEHEVWKDRYDEILKKIDDEIDIANGLFSQDPDAQLTYEEATIKYLRELLDCLKKFATNQFNYFYYGFFDVEKGDEFAHLKDLTPLKKFPKENVMNATLNQVGHDLWVISSAISQRAKPNNSDALKKADFLSHMALKPMLQNDLDEVRVISYMLKSPSVRVIPYAKTALVGIPQTVGKVSRDFLAIPHEIGHVVYWLGRVKLNGQTTPIFTKLQQSIPNKQVFTSRWLEEIFADIYGASVAGPALALSFQNLHLEVPQEEFFLDDFDHPPPILRPNIYIKVLQKTKAVENGFAKYAKALHTRWNGEKNGEEYLGGKIEERLDKDQDLKKNSNRPQEEVIERYERKFKKGDGKYWDIEGDMTIDLSEDPKEGWNDNLKIDKLAKFVFRKIQGPPGSGWIDFKDNWWLKDVNDSDDTGQLFPMIKAKVDSLNQENKAFSDEVSSIASIEFIGVDYDELQRQWIEEGKIINPDLKEEYEWIWVFMASGWTTEGPHSNPPPP